MPISILRCTPITVENAAQVQPTAVNVPLLSKVSGSGRKDLQMRKFLLHMGGAELHLLEDFAGRNYSTIAWDCIVGTILKERKSLREDSAKSS